MTEQKLPIPLYNKLLIKPVDIEKEKILKSGIILPVSVRQKQFLKCGKIANVGPGYRNIHSPKDYIPTQVKINDYVYFDASREFDEIMINDETYYIISEDFVLAIAPNMQENKPGLKLVPNLLSTGNYEDKTNIVQLFPQTEPVVTKEPEK